MDVEVKLTNCEMLPLYDGHVFRCIAHREGVEPFVLEIPIPYFGFERFELFDKLTKLFP